MHPHTGAGAHVAMSLRQVAPFYVFALLCFLVAPYRVSVASARDIEPGWVTVQVTDHGIGVPMGQE